MAAPQVSKQKFKRELPALRDELLDLQLKLHASKTCAVAVIIIGTPAAGRSETVNEFLEWLDPKHISVHALGPAGSEDRRRPPLWRYWQKLPARGRMTFFFAGWYTDYLHEATHEPDQPRDKRAVERIVRLEQMLVRDRVRVVKIHLHTDEETQHRRIAELRASKLTRWRVTKEDRWQAKHFRIVQRAMRSCMKATDHDLAPWHSIDGTDEEYRLLAVGRILRDELRTGLQEQTVAPTQWPEETPPKPLPTLAVEQPTAQLDEDEYERQLETLQGRLARLVRKGSFRKRGLVLAFEGMDAAGKGGAIRRITHALDARQYQVIPISAPAPEELLHPYLWRFWRHVPERGAIAIFDRSWYGRVLVERVRGLAAEADWQRAYAEIVEFERQLTEHGLCVAKFWLSVSKEEQLRRFQARDEDPLKRFKVDREDWANRRYYDAYQCAAAEMVRRTDRDDAPWTVVPADDKRQARLLVLTSVCEALER